ncbi:hypothetical protein GQ44DRAFT_220647 [Phaeosphaeriaceae sp. PMI808]|nr:hypothetical protein GQ44DRAFT_220647 [Phaeosphaeriaceae sp. PMI808]
MAFECDSPSPPELPACSTACNRWMSSTKSSSARSTSSRMIPRPAVCRKLARILIQLSCQRQGGTSVQFPPIDHNFTTPHAHQCLESSLSQGGLGSVICRLKKHASLPSRRKASCSPLAADWGWFSSLSRLPWDVFQKHRSTNAVHHASGCSCCQSQLHN